MVLSGWTEALVSKNDAEPTKENGASSSTASQTVSVTEEDDEVIILPLPGKKRKSLEGSAVCNVDGNENIGEAIPLADGTGESKKAREP